MVSVRRGKGDQGMSVILTITIILFNILLIGNLVAARGLIRKLAAQNSVLRLMVSIEDSRKEDPETE